jgi:simple sugar transport system substrate-binding protein
MRFLIAAAVAVMSWVSVAQADPLKVGFVYVGPVGDHGWTYMHDIGRQAVVAEFGDAVETIYVESVPEGPDAERVMRGMIADGADIIFTTSFGYMEQTLRVAKENPDVVFEHATGYKTAPNVSVYSSRFYEGRYVQGVIAGHMSDAGKAGYIASFPIPEVIRGINAFYLGATAVNPAFDIDVVWVNTWYDPGKEADAAKVLIAGGADIITQHTDSPSPLATAAAANVKGFGQASDMIQFAPDTQLTAILDIWGPYYIERIRAVMDGTWETKNTWGGMDTGMVGMADYTNMSPELAALAAQLQDDITTGKFKPFGDMTDANLGGMMDYVDGLDAAKP